MMKLERWIEMRCGVTNKFWKWTTHSRKHMTLKGMKVISIFGKSWCRGDEPRTPPKILYQKNLEFLSHFPHFPTICQQYPTNICIRKPTIIFRKAKNKLFINCLKICKILYHMSFLASRTKYLHNWWNEIF